MRRVLHSRPIRATCQMLIGYRFGGAIIGRKFETHPFLYIQIDEKREKGYNPFLSLQNSSFQSFSTFQIPDSTLDPVSTIESAQNPQVCLRSSLLPSSLQFLPCFSLFSAIFWSFLFYVNNTKMEMNITVHLYLQSVLPSLSPDVGGLWSTLDYAEPQNLTLNVSRACVCRVDQGGLIGQPNVVKPLPFGQG